MYNHARELSPVLQVDKDEWEAFRSEFSKLTKNYELVLGKLEQAQAQIRMLSQQNEALRTEARVATPPPTNATKGITEPVKSELAEDKEREPVQKLGEAESAGGRKHGFLESFRFRLSRLGSGQRNSYAYCRRCGYQIREASRFCSGCGVDFGVFLCSCGRDLSRGDRYCDWCGRKVKLH